MSTRALKRLQQRQSGIQQKSNEDLTSDSDEGSSAESDVSETRVPSKPALGNAFALLQANDEPDVESSEESDENAQRSAKEERDAKPPSAESTPTQHSARKQKKTKKQKKKSPKSASKNVPSAAETDSDVDSSDSGKDHLSPSRAHDDPWTVDANFLNPSFELNIQTSLGNLNDARSKASSKSKTAKKGLFTDDILAKRMFGISMNLVGDEQTAQMQIVHEGDLFKVVEMQAYRAWLMLDLGMLQELSAQHPHHPTLLQRIAYSHLQQQSLETAMFYLKRVLQVYQQILHPRWQSSTMNFQLITNRPFFYTLHLHGFLAYKQNMCQSAFEIFKFLYRLNPADDPLGVLYSLDLLALRARQYQWILDVLEKTDHIPWTWYFSKSLALFFLDRLEDGRKAFQEAMSKFPWFAVQLAERCLPRYSNQSLAVLETSSEVKQMDPYQRILCDYHMDLSVVLWKTPIVEEFLKSCLNDVKVKTLVVPTVKNQAGLLRAVYLYQTLHCTSTSIIQRRLPQMKSTQTLYGMEEQSLWDPFPPLPESNNDYSSLAPYDVFFRSHLVQTNLPLFHSFFPLTSALLADCKPKDDETVDEVLNRSRNKKLWQEWERSVGLCFDYLHEMERHTLRKYILENQQGPMGSVSTGSVPSASADSAAGVMQLLVRSLLPNWRLDTNQNPSQIDWFEVPGLMEFLAHSVHQ